MVQRDVAGDCDMSGNNHIGHTRGIRCRLCQCNLDPHRRQAIARCVNKACAKVGEWVKWR